MTVAIKKMLEWCVQVCLKASACFLSLTGFHEKYDTIEQK